MVIYILSKNEYEDLIYECPICICEEVKCEELSEIISTTTTTKKNITTTRITTKTPTTLTTHKTNVETTTTTKKQEVINQLININNATLEELMSLSGIGEAIAKRIIEYRESYWLFVYI